MEKLVRELVGKADTWVTHGQSREEAIDFVCDAKVFNIFPTREDRLDMETGADAYHYFMKARYEKARGILKKRYGVE
ncbi:hypothetical protein HNV12_01915 [Methanococcoides sp. SA1]|nr:hypothetical protein [Methanococcoides sp. SA1]